MKKFLLPLLGLLLLTSCEEAGSHYTEREELRNSQTVNTNYQVEFDFTEFTFRGHDYIWVQNHSMGTVYDSASGGPVHDPDCRKCHPENAWKHPRNKDNSFPESAPEPEETPDEELSEYRRMFGK